MITNKLIVEFDSDKVEKLQEWKDKQGKNHGAIKQRTQKIILEDLEKLKNGEINGDN